MGTMKKLLGVGLLVAMTLPAVPKPAHAAACTGGVIEIAVYPDKATDPVTWDGAFNKKYELRTRWPACTQGGVNYPLRKVIHASSGTLATLCVLARAMGLARGTLATTNADLACETVAP